MSLFLSILLVHMSHHIQVQSLWVALILTSPKAIIYKGVFRWCRVLGIIGHGMVLQTASLCLLSGHLGVSDRSKLQVFGLLQALAKVGWEKSRKHAAPIGCGFEASFGTNSN